MSWEESAVLDDVVFQYIVHDLTYRQFYFYILLFSRTDIRANNRFSLISHSPCPLNHQAISLSMLALPLPNTGISEDCTPNTAFMAVRPTASPLHFPP